MIRQSIILLLVLVVLTACKNHYNEMIEWTDNIKIGSDIQFVKDCQPDFIEIDWKKPESYKNETYYLITKIKGSRDILNMSHFLVFIDGKYQGRKSHK